MRKMLDIDILYNMPVEFPAWVLYDRLKGYSNIPQKIMGLVNSGHIIRLKQGWYCLGEKLRKRGPSMEYLACVLNGTAVVSLQYALSQYGMIPEIVMVMTAVSAKRSAALTTPFGKIIWKHVPPGALTAGVSRSEREPYYLLASPEKALMDLLWTTRWAPENHRMWSEYMLDDLRIDDEALHTLNADMLSSIIPLFKSKKLRNWYHWWNKWKSGGI